MIKNIPVLKFFIRILFIQALLVCMGLQANQKVPVLYVPDLSQESVQKLHQFSQTHSGQFTVEVASNNSWYSSTKRFLYTWYNACPGISGTTGYVGKKALKWTCIAIGAYVIMNGIIQSAYQCARSLTHTHVPGYMFTHTHAYTQPISYYSSVGTTSFSPAAWYTHVPTVGFGYEDGITLHHANYIQAKRIMLSKNISKKQKFYFYVLKKFLREYKKLNNFLCLLRIRHLFLYDTQTEKLLACYF